MSVDNAFYLVWKGGGDTPTRRHDTIEEARMEQRRLAMENPGMEFFVLRAISGVIYRDDPWRCRNFKHQKGE
jgi:hypothetical protein